MDRSVRRRRVACRVGGARAGHLLAGSRPRCSRRSSPRPRTRAGWRRFGWRRARPNAVRTAHVGTQTRRTGWRVRPGRRSADARREFEAVAAVDACPDTRDALVRGAVSIAQAGEILRTEAEVPGTEAELLELAKTGSLGAVRERARARRLDAMDRDELYAKQRQARCFAHWRDELGMIRGSFALTPEVGIGLVEPDRRRDRPAPPRRQTRRRHRRAAGRARGRRARPRRPGHRQHQAGRAGAAPGDRLARARPRPTHPGERSHIVGGGPIPPRVARQLLGNAFVKAVLTDGVAVQQVRHFGRRIPAEVRTALELGPPPEFAGVTCAELGLRAPLPPRVGPPRPARQRRAHLAGEPPAALRTTPLGENPTRPRPPAASETALVPTQDRPTERPHENDGRPAGTPLRMRCE